MWIGALYYATGIPYLLKAVPPFAEFLQFTAIEAPPRTPLLTNPLTVLLAGIGLYRLWRKPDLQSSDLATLRLTLIGHTAAVVLIFAYVAFTLRHRFDLAPFIVFGPCQILDLDNQLGANPMHAAEDERRTKPV